MEKLTEQNMFQRTFMRCSVVWGNNIKRKKYIREMKERNAQEYLSPIVKSVEIWNPEDIKFQ